jgi:hypothetical protein
MTAFYVAYDLASGAARASERQNKVIHSPCGYVDKCLWITCQVLFKKNFSVDNCRKTVDNLSSFF